MRSAGIDDEREINISVRRANSVAGVAGDVGRRCIAKSARPRAASIVARPFYPGDVTGGGEVSPSFSRILSRKEARE